MPSDFSGLFPPSEKRTIQKVGRDGAGSAPSHFWIFAAAIAAFWNLHFAIARHENVLG